VNTELETNAEYEALKAKEVAAAQTKKETDRKHDERKKALRATGLCPKCNTWCYGSCG